MLRLEQISSLLAPGFGTLLLAGCFVGSAADGLPCRTDADCGIGVACTEDPSASTLCCGGTCSASISTSSSSDATTSETGSTSSTSATVGMESSSDSSSSTTGLLCGNGMLDEGEECDPGAEDPCSDDCLLCGNGVVDGDELCDPEAVEEGVSCEDECHRLTLLAWNTMSPIEQMDVDFERPEFAVGDDTPLRWRRSADVVAPLTSGPYYTPEAGSQLDPSDGWPQSLLLTRPMEFPDLRKGDRVEIFINHAYAFNSDAEPRYFDHGRVDLVPDTAKSTADWTRLLPAGIDGGEPNCDGATPPPVIDCYPSPDMVPEEPFCDPGFERWLVGEGMDDAQLPVDLELVSGGVFQVSFRLRYDCGTLSSGIAADDNAWSLNALSVVVTRPG